MQLEREIDRASSILRDAIREYRPIRVFAGFSGGHDSLVTTHFTLKRLPDATALHLVTGIGIEATRRFVRETARDRSWPLVEARSPYAYEDLVLGRVKSYPGGFPGPPMHGGMYRRLKERPLHLTFRDLRRDSPRGGRRWFLIMTGVRGDESLIRAGYREAVRVDPGHGVVWVNPFYWATYDHFRAYRERFGLPVNPVCLTLGFSGECLCGAYADRGELLRIRLVEPATADRIEALQRAAADAGFPWGYEDDGPPKWFRDRKRGQTFFDWHQAASGPAHRPLCHNCEKVKAVPGRHQEGP